MLHEYLLLLLVVLAFIMVLSVINQPKSGSK